jgi:hypothetical protein
MRVNGLLKFNRELVVPYGAETRLSPLVSHVLAPNPGPFTFKGTGVYLVGAGESVAVIDPGPDMAEHVSALKHVIGARRISHILITHSHRDHSPAAAALKSWSGAPVYGLPDHAAPSQEEGAVDEAHDHEQQKRHPDHRFRHALPARASAACDHCIPLPVTASLTLPPQLFAASLMVPQKNVTKMVTMAAAIRPTIIRYSVGVCGGVSTAASVRSATVIGA